MVDEITQLHYKAAEARAAHLTRESSGGWWWGTMVDELAWDEASQN